MTISSPECTNCEYSEASINDRLNFVLYEKEDTPKSTSHCLRSLEHERHERHPESEKILGNVALLPSITNPAALPYRDIDENESLLVKDIPGCLLPQQKYSGKDILACFVVN